MKTPSPALMRTCGCVSFLFFGLGSLYLGNSIFDLNLNLWMLSWSDLGAKGIGLIIVVFILAIIGMVIGLMIGTSIEVESEKTDFVISSLWHYVANGFILWFIVWMMYLAKTVGRENAKEFAESIGTLPWVCLFVIPIAGCLLIACLLLLIGLLNERHKPILLSCLIPSVPIVMGMSYIQLHLFGMNGYSWVVVVMGILIPVILIPFCTFMIMRDKFQREQIRQQILQRGIKRWGIKP